MTQPVQHGTGSEPRGRYLAMMAVAALGVAHGDICTSPLYATRLALYGEHGVPAAQRLVDWVVPLTLIILIGLFLFQSKGTARIGAIFGRVMLVWFATIAVLGLKEIIHQPGVLAAVLPQHAVRFFAANVYRGFVVLGAVFLVVTGGEALYADLGHFGHRAIQFAWFSVGLPALLLNYFGQGALLLRDPSAAVNPFYHMAPSWALYPLVALATAAAIIASQAIISGAFSLTRQAVQLGYSPRLKIEHTSSRE